MNADIPHILVVDDDDRLRELLRKFLSENGFLVATAGDVADARTKLMTLTFDLIVLDLMMPGESGLDFAEDLDRRGTVPTLMLTAMGEPEDRIAGLERGADDYLAKPFEPRELLLRIHNILRRLPKRPEVPAEVRLGDVLFDLERGELRRDGNPIRLTAVEAALLKALAERPGAVLSREELTIRTGASGGGRAVDVQVTRLRRKIEPDPRLPRYLRTVRGRGYVLRPDSPDGV
ncbi:MAG: response regulator [Rhodospirillales bacterium]